MSTAIAGCSSAARRAEFITLDQSLEPLRSRFNADADRARIVALFSPT